MERLLFEWQITSPAGSRPVHEGLAALASLVKAQKSVMDWHSCPKQAPAFLSCLNQSLWTENILLFVQGYKISGTQTKPIVLDFNFCELRSDFPRVDFFTVLFCITSCDTWGLGCPFSLCHPLAQILRSDQTVPFGRKSRQGEMWTRTLHSPWLSSRGAVCRWWKVPEVTAVFHHWALKTGGSNFCKNASAE